MDASLYWPRAKYLLPFATYLLPAAFGSFVQAAARISRRAGSHRKNRLLARVFTHPSAPAYGKLSLETKNCNGLAAQQSHVAGDFIHGRYQEMRPSKLRLRYHEEVLQHFLRGPGGHSRHRVRVRAPFLRYQAKLAKTVHTRVYGLRGPSKNVFA